MEMIKPSLASLKKHLGHLLCAEITVAGDLILDGYIWGRVSRINPEAPVPLVAVDHMDFRLGGAANVAANVASLGAKVKLVGVVGDDMHGRELISLLERRGISPVGVVMEAGRPTTLKTRVIAHSQQVVRFDREVAHPLSRSIERKLEKVYIDTLSKSSMVILSDYDKGVFRGSFASKALRSAAAKKIKVAVDPKVPNVKRFAGAYIITPNHHEAAQIVGFPVENEKDVERAGKIISKKLRCPNILITRGKAGMSLYKEGASAAHVPTVIRQAFDVTGAGDTVIAVLTAAIASGAGIEEAMWLANAAAGVTVSKIGTASVTVDEIEQQLREEYTLL